MAKTPKSTALDIVDGKSADVGRFEISQEVVGFAAGLGVDLAGTLDDLADRAAEHMNRSQRHMLASGLLLAAMKDRCEHGEFTALVEERGFEERAARKAMQYAAFICSRPHEERELLIGLPKSKVLALASADAVVIEAVLADDGAASIDALSVRALQDRIRELQAQAVDTSVQLETTEAKLAAAEQKIAKPATERQDHVPLVVAELRAEIAALVKKAELAVDSFNPLGAELMALVGTEAAHAWADATIRLAVAGLASVQLQVAGVLKKFSGCVPEGELPEQSHLTLQEVVETADRWAVLTRAHEHEKALREWEAEQKAPKGRGRPKAKPEAPKGGK
ncbi:MAG: hypothetical protein DI537_44360 [Stutzerimonas stutzeri]|nr:MAG: hypothetical protein DI537_44360 [Stutzerimonas stutzeri]